MSRIGGRIGGATAGIIAIVFGGLDLANKTPSPWTLIALGAVAVLGVIIDYFWEQRVGDPVAGKIEQNQRGGRKSTNNQAARDINIDRPTSGGNP